MTKIRELIYLSHMGLTTWKFRDLQGLQPIDYSFHRLNYANDNKS